LAIHNEITQELYKNESEDVKDEVKDYRVANMHLKVLNSSRSLTIYFESD